ncbi:AAA family ATPase [Bacillus infantis]|uniref:deoxynucleotide monophosphate kinase family protein n=1 Tax=Bacillus infantis TaxID=324767 RepID=UPI003CF8B5BB
MKIALLGKMRSGKDTVAEYGINTYGLYKFAFGDELKRYYHELFGYSEGKPREGYQWFGQITRQREPDIWVRKCFESIENSGLKDIIITDLRQPNEFERCKKEGFIMVKVHCDDQLRIQRILEKNDKFDKKDLHHETEMHIDTFEPDYIIENNGSLEHLYRQLDEIVKGETMK